MTQPHFITGTTLTLLFAVSVLGNMQSATAESSDGNHGNMAAATEDTSLQCVAEHSDLDEAVIQCDALAPLDSDADRDVSDSGVDATDNDVETSELARRVSAALLGKVEASSQSIARATKQPSDAADSDRVWRCGQWEELWQGRGSARTCEWQ